MALDRPWDDELTELPEYSQPHANGADTGPEITETRTPAEYDRALRAIVDQQALAPDGTSQSADTGGRSAWDDVEETRRPPLDAPRLPPERAAHILDGDDTGGGHRHGTGVPDKSEFPANWDDDTILNAIIAVAHSPENVHQQWNQRWKARGEVDNVLIDVIIDPDGTIWTAWPDESSPGVVRNPKAGGP